MNVTLKLMGYVIVLNHLTSPQDAVARFDQCQSFLLLYDLPLIFTQKAWLTKYVVEDLFENQMDNLNRHKSTIICLFWDLGLYKSFLEF